MSLQKDNALWEYLVNNYSTSDLRKTLKSMNYSEVGDFLSDCDKLGSDILRGDNILFHRDAVAVIIEVRKIAASIGAKKLKEALK